MANIKEVPVNILAARAHAQVRRDSSGLLLKTRQHRVATRKLLSIINSLLGMPTEIPAGLVSLVREQSVDTGLVDRRLEGKLGFVVLFRNGVVPLNDDSSQRLATEMEKKTVSQIREHNDGEESDQRARLAHELTGMMIPKRWSLSQPEACGGAPWDGSERTPNARVGQER
jgi:hypothetical protein